MQNNKTFTYRTLGIYLLLNYFSVKGWLYPSTVFQLILSTDQQVIPENVWHFEDIFHSYPWLTLTVSTLDWNKTCKLLITVYVILELRENHPVWFADGWLRFRSLSHKYSIDRRLYSINTIERMKMWKTVPKIRPQA